MARGLDHVVVAVRDLDAAAKAWAELGFTVTPENRHAWGTANRLVQLDGFFIEILTVADESLIVEASEGDFSFGAFNRNFLKTRQGASMLVAEGVDPDQDRADFQRLGLTTYAPFSFERVANFKDGSTGKVGFDLTFLTDPLIPDLAFFTCRNRYPETFWNSDFQRHDNGAAAIGAIYMVASDPSDHHEFLGGFTGQREMRATSLGLEVQTPRGLISVLNPDAYRHLVGDAAANEVTSSSPQIAAVEVVCDGLVSRKVIPADEALGITAILTPAV
ncbi:VOC family protein [Roseibium sp.]|uniref:VOC family protein n=2 Tax=Alphaproteobacteria TaxID=28211 RepID=UPI003267B5D5